MATIRRSSKALRSRRTARVQSLTATAETAMEDFNAAEDDAADEMADMAEAEAQWEEDMADMEAPEMDIEEEVPTAEEIDLLKLSLKTGLPEVKKFLIELPQLLRPEMPPLKTPGNKKTKETLESGTTELRILLMPKKISKMKFWMPKLDLKKPSNTTELWLTGKPSKNKLKTMSK